MLSFEDKIFIEKLWECKRFSARRLLREGNFLTRTGNDKRQTTLLLMALSIKIH